MMTMTSAPHNRIGLHYFPDTLHYRESDLAAWLPELQALNAAWLVLAAPADRAIPENFIRGLAAAGIQPVLHFDLPLTAPPKAEDLSVLLHTYAQWGVQYAVFFDRPNSRKKWPGSAWAQDDLVERFLDIFLPLAQASMQAGLKPVFPPLEPGGDYWDTAFLRAALESLQARSAQPILDSLVLGASAWAGSLPLDWGAGGPERWSGARPYFTPPGEQDQRGFRIYEWYTAISQAAASRALPILLMGAGCEAQQPNGTQPASSQTERTLQMVAMLENTAGEPDSQDSVPPHVLAGTFRMLAANPGDPHAHLAWYQADGRAKPMAQALKARRLANPGIKAAAPSKTSAAPAAPMAAPPTSGGRAIEHYLLLPVYEWGVADWHLDVIRPFVKKHRPTIGFSVAEASRAAKVTVVGGVQSFPPEIIANLRTAGCLINQIDGDGTSIASQLESL
ncbi:MAG: hypothetical protein OEZ02_02860 [Anaerolineae bacterium]|nr:hypothetical protein [Anaerolineae bacterium]